MNNFNMRISEFFSDFGTSKKIVLSTSDKNIVSSRMMSVVQINREFYFQTDMKLRKYQQLKKNTHVALCIDNIQIEGLCKELGHPLENETFCNTFMECFKGAYDAYTSLTNERLFVIKPTYIERWIYKDGTPYIESFDINAKNYRFEKYGG